MASVFKPRFTKNGKTCRTRKWYVKYRDASGRVRRVPGFTDKSATLQLAAQLEREAAQGQVGMVSNAADAAKRPLVEHLGDHVQYLRDKGNGAQHVREVKSRCSKIISACGFAYIRDMTANKVLSYLAGRRKGGLSIQSSNHYLRQMKSFSRWLHRERRAPEDPLLQLSLMNAQIDRRHERRSLTAIEFAKLIDATINGKRIEGVHGPDRAMLYVLAAWTGYRRGELGSLTLRSFDLDADSPTVTVQASFSKRRRRDPIPLHPEVVRRFKDWLAIKGEIDPDGLLLPVAKRKTWKMMKLDLAAAGIAYKDENGLYADFHAHRVAFITNLARAGLPLTTVQKLARHSDPKLTSNLYAKVTMGEKAAAIEMLAAPPQVSPVSPATPTVPIGDKPEVPEAAGTSSSGAGGVPGAGAQRGVA